MKKGRMCINVLLLALLCLFMPASGMAVDTVGVLFVAHGGFDNYQPQYLWDASVQMFSYEPNHSVYKQVIWNPANWGMVLTSGNAPKEIPKYAFNYGRIGGTDPFSSLTEQQIADMKAELDAAASGCGLKFEVDWAYWMSGDDPSHYIYPRFLYYGPDGPGVGSNCTYCGELEAGGPWPGCNPNRYDIDGPVERLLTKGISRIIIVDITVGGVRFSKTYDILKMTRKILSDKGSAIPITWINDINNLMTLSYPTDPATWTPQWSYAKKAGPKTDPSVPLAPNPNPITTSPTLTILNVEGIEASMSPSISDHDTGILLLNHAIVDWAEYFDPKINDTVALNELIKAELLTRHPTTDPDNIIGAYMGIKENGSSEGCNAVEPTRRMRGENIGYAWLYETAKQLPGDEWGYRYWDALEYLKNRGVKHIIIGFPQIVTDSVLSLVEIPNQIGKEIGIKTWIKWATLDFTTYPGIGHPFADYWGVWVNTDCGGVPCCFVMGGCGDGRPYPPPRQSCAREDLDPSLAYDLSDYGHLGYDPALGSPDPNNPVQNQYTGTWAMWMPPSANPRLGRLLGDSVLNQLSCPPPTVITLTAFNAIPGNREVTVSWTTASEIDNAGFNIYRSESENGAYVKLNGSLIPAKGSPSAGATYQFPDKEVKNRKTYWYKLEDIDIHGVSTMHGSVSAIPLLIKSGKK